MNKKDDKSGLYSLSGFAYQIKVFFYYAMCLKNSKSSIEFETIDDVAIKKEDDLKLKDFSSQTNIYEPTSSFNVIQVKYTKISKIKTKKILLNWILASKKHPNITNFILFTDDKYENNNYFDEISAKELYLFAINDKQENKKSIKWKIKEQFYTNGKYKDFLKLYKKIKANRIFKSEKDIENEIKEVASNHFKRGAVPEEVYCARLNAALQVISSRILEYSIQKKSYSISLTELNKIEENIIKDINEEMPIPLSYSEYKNHKKIDFNKYENKREYRQLKYCELSTTAIVRNLQQCCYYADYRYQILAMNKEKCIADIETESYENFERVKENLIYKDDDTPRNRLDKTQEIRNEKLPIKELSLGSYIYLTQDKETVPNNQISWKEDNE